MKMLKEKNNSLRKIILKILSKKIFSIKNEDQPNNLCPLRTAWYLSIKNHQYWWYVTLKQSVHLFLGKWQNSFYF